MSTASLALEAQVWSVMESLAKAAAAEICSLVDSQCVEMRLEIRRGQTEIESLKGKLRELRKALREKSTSTVSQINPQLGESERDIRADYLHQEADCEHKERDKKTSSPGLKNLQEDSIQDDLYSHLNSGINQFTQSQILSNSLNSKGKADTGGLHTAAIKMEAGSCSVSTAECIYKNSQNKQELSPDTKGPVMGVQEHEKRRTEMETRKENLNRRKEESQTLAPKVKVKIESIEDDEKMQIVQNTRTELALQSGSTENEELAQVWLSEQNTEMHSPEFFHTTHHQAHHRSNPSATMETSHGQPVDRMETKCSNGEDLTRHSEPSTDRLDIAMDDLLRAQNVPGLQQSNSNIHNTLIQSHPETQSNFSALSALSARGRPINQAMDVDKRQFPCMFCCKTFDRPSHAERHQCMHTGEKPFSCRLCGQSFSWKSSLKSHLTTHRIAGLPDEDVQFSNEWHMASHCEEQIAAHSLINSQETHSDDYNPHLSCLPEENTHFINIEGESMEHPAVDHQSTLISPNKTQPDRTNVDLCEFEDHDEDDDDDDDDDDDVVCLAEKGMKAKKKDEGKEQMLINFGTDEPRKIKSVDIEGEWNKEALNSVNASSSRKDLESDCSDKADYGVPQSKYQIEATSTIVYSWGPTVTNNSKGFESNQTDVKEEDDDDNIVALDEEQISPKMYYSMQSEESSKAPNINQLSTSNPLQTTEASVVPNVRAEPIPPRLRVSRRRERRFICVHCGKTFDRISHLERHQLVHTGEKPYSCGLCGRGFTQKIHLKGHMQTHLQERAFHCSTCGMSFPTRAGRDRHCCPQIQATDYLR